jgi:predicted GNAT superfamily acetyltransferase
VTTEAVGLQCVCCAVMREIETVTRHHRSLHSNTRTTGSSFKLKQTDKIFARIRKLCTQSLLILWAVDPLVSVQNTVTLFICGLNRKLR